MSERCRECDSGIFTRRRTGNTVNRARVVSRYPPDGSLRAGEQVVCAACGTPHRALYDPTTITWRLKQDGPPQRARFRG